MHMGWAYVSRCICVPRYIQAPFEMVALYWERRLEQMIKRANTKKNVPVKSSKFGLKQMF